MAKNGLHCRIRIRNNIGDGRSLGTLWKRQIDFDCLTEKVIEIHPGMSLKRGAPISLSVLNYARILCTSHRTLQHVFAEIIASRSVMGLIPVDVS